MLFGLAAGATDSSLIAEFGMVATAISISVLGILIYGPDMLMSGAATVDAVPPAQIARALGIVNGIGSLGQLISAYVVTLIVSRFGRDQLFTFFVGCSVAASGLMTLRWNKGLEKS
jgi:sugar phosphate permease